MKFCRKIPPLALLAFAALISVAGLSAARAQSYAWVQWGTDGNNWVRSLSASQSCPVLKIDGKATPLTPRRSAAAPSFSILSCEAPLPSGFHEVEVDGIKLKAPGRTMERIAILGDTGCRLKRGDPPQSCDDPKAWPFPRVAQAIVDFKPDLIIHVGDYVYREMPCPKGDADCRGSPYGDTWAAWQADFFAPAQDLLRTAPWIFVRGNHENCKREGWGWFVFLDPRPLPSTCLSDTDPYFIEVGGERFAVLDSSSAADSGKRPEEIVAFRRQFQNLFAQAKAPFTLLSHRPLWGLQPRANRPPVWRNLTLSSAIAGIDLNPLKQAISGHIHLFEALTFSDGRPRQWVVGNGGTELDPPLPAEGSEAGVFSYRDFGFLSFEKREKRWIAVLRDLDGKAIKEFPDTGFR